MTSWLTLILLKIEVIGHCFRTTFFGLYHCVSFLQISSEYAELHGETANISENNVIVLQYSK